MTSIDSLADFVAAHESTHPSTDTTMTILYTPGTYEPSWRVTIPFIAEEGFAGRTLEDAGAAALKQAQVVGARESEVPDIPEP